MGRAGAGDMHLDLYRQLGPDPLSDHDLLAIALTPGAPRGPRTLASDLLDRHGSLAGLLRTTPERLAETPGLPPVRATRLHLALHLGARAARAQHPTPGQIVQPEHAVAWFRPTLDGQRDELLAALFLDRRMRPIGCRVLTRGTASSTLVDPRQIFRVALELGAQGVVLAHNHPSGDPDPSGEDLRVTAQVARVGEAIGIPLLDHLILTDNAFTSLACRGELSSGAWRGQPLIASSSTPQRRSL